MLEYPITDVFFDLDHTLWDFERNSALTYEKIFRANGVDVSLTDFLEVYVPANLQYWKLFREGKIGKEDLRYKRLKSVFDRIGYSASDSLIHRLSEAYIEHLCAHTHLMPSALEILKYLQGTYRMHIITNGFEEVQRRKLNNSGIDSYFSQVVNSEMAGVKKPDPGIFRLAMKMARVPAEKAVMIGDSLEADILGARGVGLQTLHFNVHGDAAHPHGPIIDQLGEIKNYL
jgi:putative hydrolase of the HAD superfamily